MSGRRGSGDRGASLIELTVVVAVFSLVAVIAVQALGGAITSRARIAERSAATAELSATLALLRRDLGAMVPVALDGPAFALDAGRLSLVAAGQPDLAGSGRDGLARIVWETGSDGSLTRSTGADRVTLLGGVSGWEARALDGDGWRSSMGGEADAQRRLPRAVEVRLATADLPDLRVLVTR